MTRRDPRANPVSTDSAEALDASERALWRMMSFYGTPLDDLDAAVAADPRWMVPRLMHAGAPVPIRSVCSIKSRAFARKPKMPAA